MLCGLLTGRRRRRRPAAAMAVSALRFIRECRAPLFLLFLVYLGVLKVLHERFASRTPTAIELNDFDAHLDDFEPPVQLLDAEPDPPPATTPTRFVVAVGLAITSKGADALNESNIGDAMELTRTLLPSFCLTASHGVVYRFYLAYDADDDVFRRRRMRAAFRRQFDERAAAMCGGGGGGRTDDERRRLWPVVVELRRFVRCPYAGRPAWSQNDAMMEAYLDGADYFYRVNDDTLLLTAGWTSAFVGVLETYSPPRVGVVGPNHVGGNVEILTYDFVHRTHVDVFGFYYPRLFTDWWADDWVTRVYRPGRSTKLLRVRLAHTSGLGRRYEVEWRAKRRLVDQLAHDVMIVRRYVEAVRSRNQSAVDRRHVVSVSLYGFKPHHVWGVIRIAQLVPVFLPAWQLRVYITNSTVWSLTVPGRVLTQLRRLGAEIVTVDGSVTAAPRDWRLLAFDDSQVDFVLIRDAEWRPTEREAAAINDWVRMSRTSPGVGVVHCLRDHPRHAEHNVVDGLWGGRRAALLQLLSGQSLTNMSENTSNWLDEKLWPIVANVSICHDGVSSCDRWPYSAGRRPFTVLRKSKEYVGQKYDEHQELVRSDWWELDEDVNCDEERMPVRSDMVLT